MTGIFSSWLNVIGVVTSLVLVCLYVYYLLFTARYWSKRNAPHLEPNFLLGSLWRVNFLRNINHVLADIHLENKDKKMLGIWSFYKPNLMVMDTELVKRILITDFNHFRDRGFEISEELEPLTGHLFLLGKKRWRNLRVKLTPTFTSGKMKMMFPNVLKCAEELRRYLKAPSERKETIEVKDLLSRYTIDVIASCAFGLEANSIKNPNSEFRDYGRKILTVSIKQAIKNTFILALPKIAKALKLRLQAKELSDYFINLIDTTIKYREKTQTVRNDFLQLLIQLMRAGKIEDADKTPLDQLGDEEIAQKFSLHEAAAQCFVFFLAGFETSATTLTFALYELALNPDIQTRLQSEIDEMVTSSGGDITYEHVIGSQYLDMVIQETLRKYPPLGNLQRKCGNTYHIPGTETTLEKGIVVFISVLGIHRDPDIYPEPDKFDPERFSPEEKNKRGACTFLPFGDGPRNCIGNRFGLMQTKVGLMSIMRDYNVEVTKGTPIPIEYNVRGFLLAVEGGMNLVFTRRS